MLSFATLPVVIWVSGEKRVLVRSRPYLGQSPGAGDWAKSGNTDSIIQQKRIHPLYYGSENVRTAPLLWQGEHVDPLILRGRRTAPAATTAASASSGHDGHILLAVLTHVGHGDSGGGVI